MPDFMLKGIDNEMAAQIKDLAQKSGAPINDLMLNLLKRGIKSMQTPAAAPSLANGTAPIAQVGMLVQKEAINVTGILDNDEDAALKAALAALESLPEDVSPFRAGR